MKHTQLITGASGGMIGAAFYRELYYLYEQNKLSSYHSSEFSKNISKDLLNPLIYYAAINDLFLRLGEFNDGEYTYKKDRGYAFEKSLNENTANIFGNGEYILIFTEISRLFEHFTMNFCWKKRLTAEKY